MTALLTLDQLRRVTPPGECPFCGEPIPRKFGRGRRLTHCGDPVCRLAYQRVWQRSYRRRHGHRGGHEPGTGNTPPQSVILDDHGI